MAFERGKPKGKLKDARQARRTGAAPRCASSPTRRSSAPRPRSSRSACSRWRARRPICSAASKSAGPATRRCSQASTTCRSRRRSISSDGLKDYLAADAARRDAGPSRHLRRQGRARPAPRRGRMGGRLGRRRRRLLSSYCNTIPTPDGGTHEVGPARGADCAASRITPSAPARASAPPTITSDDVMIGAGCMLSVFIREPEFQGQTKDRLATAEAQRIVENAIKDQFDHWLAGNPAAGQQAARLRDRARRRAHAPPRRKRKSRARARRASCACPASSPTAPTPPRRARRFSSSRATRPAARPSRRATAPRRRCCRCAARSSTSPPPARTSSRRTSSLPIWCRRSAAAPARTTATRICATRRSS